MLTDLEIAYRKVKGKKIPSKDKTIGIDIGLEEILAMIQDVKEEK